MERCPDCLPVCPVSWWGVITLLTCLPCVLVRCPPLTCLSCVIARCPDSYLYALCHGDVSCLYHVCHGDVSCLYHVCPMSWWGVLPVSCMPYVMVMCPACIMYALCHGEVSCLYHVCPMFARCALLMYVPCFYHWSCWGILPVCVAHWSLCSTVAAGWHILQYCFPTDRSKNLLFISQCHGSFMLASGHHRFIPKRNGLLIVAMTGSKRIDVSSLTRLIKKSCEHCISHEASQKNTHMRKEPFFGSMTLALEPIISKSIQ